MDVFDRPFAPYAVPGPQAGQRVDLSGDGSMLASLEVIVRPTSEGLAVTVRPSAQHLRQATYLHRGTPHMPARPWLGLSPRDLLALQRFTVRVP